MSKFDNLYEKYLNRISEDLPVSLMPGIEPNYGDVDVSFPEKANYTITPTQAGQAINDVVDYLLTRNRRSPLPYKTFQSEVVASKIMGRTSLNRTKAVWAARVLHNAMIKAGIITDEKSGTTLSNTPTEETVEEVADEVSTETETMSQDTTLDNKTDQDETDQDEATSYFKAKDFPPEIDDEELEAAWNKLPDDNDIEWLKILKLIGLTKAEQLREIRAILPATKADFDEDEQEAPVLDLDDEDYDDYNDLDEIDPTIVRRSPYRDSYY